jgi:hypothetical protein
MSTEERLERLEREVRAERRRTRWLLVVGGMVVVGLALGWTWATFTATAQAQGANIGPKMVRANQFILEDETGTDRAILYLDKNGPTLFGENGKLMWSAP